MPPVAPDPTPTDPSASPDAASEAPKKRRRAEGDLTSSDAAEAPKKKRRAEGDLTSSDAAEAPKKRRRENGDLTSSDAAEAPKKRRAEGDLTSSDVGAAPKKRRVEGDVTSSDGARVKKRRRADGTSSSSDVDEVPPAKPTPAAPTPAPEREAEDALVGLFAVKEGLVTEAQVEKAKAKQRADAEPKALARVLVETGALTLEQRDAVLAKLDPQVIPGYQLEAEAGRGGMGVVYRARQLSMDRVVAVKVLSRRLSSDPSYVTKFLAEARSAGKLNHENIVAAIDAGAAAGLHFFVMEYVSGRSVAETIEADGPIAPERAFAIAEEVARGLGHAHQAKLVHRDVKPENILLTADGRAKLCDLGLAKPAQVAGTGGKSDMTEGTPYYCSPEQALGRTDIDARSDVYSLGTTLYHMLKGEPPYDGDNARAILVKQVREPFPDLDVTLPDVPPALRRLLWEMVKKDRDQRLPSMRAFEERLVAARRAEAAGAPAPRAGRGGGGGAVLALVAVVFLVFLGVGAVVASAVLGDDTPVTVTETPTVTEVAPPETTEVRPRVTRVTDPRPDDEPRPATTTTPPRATETAPGTSEAARALAQARRVQADKIDDPLAARDAFLDVEARFKGTPEADEARREGEALKKPVFDLGFKRFEALTTQAIGLVRDGKFRDACDAITAFSAEWEPRGLPGLGDQLGNLRRAVDQQAQVRLDDALKRLEAATTPEATTTAQRDVDDLLQRVPQTVADAARPRLEAFTRGRAQREAEAALRVVLARRDEALSKGDRAAAGQALDAARGDRALAVVADALARAQTDFKELSRAWDAFDASCARLGEDERGRLRLREGEPLRGRLIEYDPVAWRGQVKLFGQREQVPLDVRDLHPEELAALALPPSDGRANVLFFLARGVPEAAAVALAAWRATGGDDAALAVTVQQALAGAIEARVAARLDAAIAPDASAEVVLALVASIDDALRATAAYRERHEQLKAAMRRVRAAQLQAAPELLFKGQLKSARRGEAVTLTYTFKDAAQLADWQPDLAIDPASSVRHSDDGMICKGKLTHMAAFQGGELAIEVRATTSNGRQPNLNVIIGDRGGWTGVLFGLGFMYGALQDLRVDPTAPKKPGYTVPLPANVCISLNGSAPSVTGQNFAAETAPAVQGTQGRPHKFDASRAADGAVRLRLRGREVYRLPPMPEWDLAAAVALAPFGTEIVVHEVEIVGRLDEAWIAARALAVATLESNMLPAPTVPGR
jgi:serine/threonine-protein kinase